MRSRLAALLILSLLISCNREGVAPTPQVQSPPKKAEEKITSRTDEVSRRAVEESKESVYIYNPEGKRDPFKPPISAESRKELLKVPPLLRIEPKDLRLLGIAWGWFGYSAMVQTTDGKAYPIRVGTPIGPRNGAVKSINEKGLIIEERYTDIYGERKTRETKLELPSREEVQ